MPENSPSYPLWLLNVALNGFQLLCTFPPVYDMTTGKGPSWHWGTKTTKCRKSDSWSVMLLRKDLDQKEGMWKWTKETSYKIDIIPLTWPSRKRKISSRPDPHPTVSYPCLQPMRSHHRVNLSYSSSELLLKTPPCFLLSCLKGCFPHHSLHVPNCNSLAIPEQTHWLLDSFCLLFKVDHMQIVFMFIVFEILHFTNAYLMKNTAK